MEIVLKIVGVLVAYLLGSMANAVWIGRIFYGTDVRKEGSKNAGATNTIRVLGLKPGIVVLVLDAFKGWLPVFIANYFAPDLSEETLVYYELLLGLVAVLGHIFPIYVGFKGGKGVATIMGVLIALYWNIVPALVVIFIIVFLIWRYISLASMITALCFPFIYWGFTHIFEQDFHTPLFIFACLVAVFIPFTHRKNIKRLLKGEENKFLLKKKKDGTVDETKLVEDLEDEYPDASS